jgi:hypothetical protein
MQSKIAIRMLVGTRWDSFLNQLYNLSYRKLASKEVSRAKALHFAATYLALAICGAFLLSSPASAGTVTLNGACILGNCSSPTPLPYGGSFSSPFSETFSVNGDKYSISGSLNTSSPSYLSFGIAFKASNSPIGFSSNFFAQNASPLPDTFAFDLNFAAGTKYGAQIAINEGVTAVPEPSTWAMLLLGFGGLGAATRWRNRQSVATV